ncbi:MAG: ATP-binding protein [Candidatus Thorarchaeota archaeon]
MSAVTSGKTDGIKTICMSLIRNRELITKLVWIMGMVICGLYLSLVYIIPSMGLSPRLFVANRLLVEILLCVIPFTSGLILTRQNIVIENPDVEIEDEFLILDMDSRAIVMSCLELSTVSGSIDTDSEGNTVYNNSMLLALKAGASQNVSFAYEVGIASGQPFLRIFITVSHNNRENAKEILRREATRLEAILLSSLKNIELQQLRGDSLRKVATCLSDGSNLLESNPETKVIITLKGMPRVSPTSDSSQIGTFLSTMLKQSYAVSFTCVFSGTKPGKERRQLESEWRSIRSKEKRKDDSLADHSEKKKLLDQYELIQSNTGWFKSSTYLVLSANTTTDLERIKQGVRGLVRSIWGSEKPIEISDTKLTNKHLNRVLTRRHFKPQSIHVSRLVAFVNTPVQPLPVIAPQEVPVFPLPSSDILKNELSIGWAVYGGQRLSEVGLKTDWLREHIAVLGATGTGKTTLVKKIIAELTSKTDVPWWIFDVKGSEYTDLSYIGDVSIIRPGLDPTFMISLIDSEGSSLVNQAHSTFSILRELIKENSASELSPAMEKLLRESVMDLVDNTDGNLSVQTLVELIRKNANESRIGTMTRDALLNRLEILVREPLGSILSGGSDSIRISELLGKRIVFDMRHISRVGGMDATRLLYNLVAKRIFDSSMRRGILPGLHHVVVLEEASNLVPESYSRHTAADITTGESMVMLQRATGQGVIVVSTRPNISSNILANTSTKITFRLPYDSGIGGRFMSVTPEQEQYLRTLKRGRALIVLPTVKTFEMETMLLDFSLYPNVSETRVVQHEKLDVSDSDVISTSVEPVLPPTTHEKHEKITRKKEKTVVFDRLGEMANHIIAFLASRKITTNDDIRKFIVTLDSRMTDQDISDIIRDLVSLSTIQRESISLVPGGVVFTLPGNGLNSVRDVIIKYIAEKLGSDSPAKINYETEIGPDIIVDDCAISVIPEHIRSSSMDSVLDRIRIQMNQLGSDLTKLIIVVRGSVAAAKLREIVNSSDEFVAVHIVSAFPSSLDKMIENVDYSRREIQSDDIDSGDKIDLIEAVHEVGSATSRAVQMRLWFGLIQDFVDLSKGNIIWKTLLEFIDTTSLQSLKGRSAPMNAEDGRRALTELLADEALCALRVGNESGVLNMEQGLWIVNASVLKGLKDLAVRWLEKELRKRYSTVSKNHEYYDLCADRKSFVIFPTQQQLNTLLRLHSDVACRTCKSTEVICILTASEYLDDSVVTPSNLIMKTMDDGLATIAV